MNKASKPDGLYPNYFNPKSGNWGQSKQNCVYNFMFKIIEFFFILTLSFCLETFLEV